MRRSQAAVVSFVAALAVGLTVGPAARGDEDHDHDRRESRDRDEDHERSARHAASGHDREDDEGEDEDDYDDEESVTGAKDDDGSEADERGEEAEHRKEYLAGEKKRLLDDAMSDGDITEEDKKIVRQHWMDAMELLRIRHLAKLGADKASADKADAVLARLDRRTDDELRKAAKSGGAK